jgi:hypothetical protein
MINDPGAGDQTVSQTSLQKKVDTARSAAGVRVLTDEEVLLLLADSIAHTHTYEEKGYR